MFLVYAYFVKNMTLSLNITLYIASIMTFFIGASLSLYIYLTSQDVPESVFYDYEHSKRYRHEMEAAGGKLNIVLNEMYQQFLRLFEGRALALFVAVITLMASISLIFIALRINSNSKE